MKCRLLQIIEIGSGSKIDVYKMIVSKSRQPSMTISFKEDLTRSFYNQSGIT